MKSLESFVVEGLKNYSEERNRPDHPGTSRLSPHLHFGEISPRQIWHSLREQGGTAWESSQYATEIGWREFAYHLLVHWPETPEHPLREEWRHFPEHHSPKDLTAWQKGRTGYPIVDAGMRQLWATGWMHNRVRMIVASFLIKDLFLPWQEGARWFWDTLVDGDLASNTLGWQWTAGCGADAAPYFRIFNPITQGQKFDPEGDYIRTWVQELAKVPTAQIHTPWETTGLVEKTGYVMPVVDHKQARDRALAAYQKLREKR